MPPRGMMGANALSAYTPTYSERIPQFTQDALMGLGVPTRRANTLSHKIAGLLDYTPVGAVAGVMDAGAAARRQPTTLGKMAGLGSGAVMAALGAVPGGKAVGRKAEALAMDEASRMARALAC